MALSNWDTLAFDLNGPCTGRVESQDGRSVEIYKNWLYLRDGDKIIGTLHEGNFSFGQWIVLARRGPQNGVYVVAHAAHYAEGGRTEERILVGCGVSGFEDAEEKYRDEIEAADIDPELGLVYTTWAEDGGERFMGVNCQGEEVLITDQYNIAFTGVLPSSVKFLQGMVDEVIAENTAGSQAFWPAPELAAIDWEGATRFNQGDGFFAAYADVAAPGTPPGEAEAPIIMAMLGNEDGATPEPDPQQSGDQPDDAPTCE